MSSELKNFFDVLFQQIQVYEIILLSTNNNHNKWNVMENLISRNVISRYPTRNWNFHKLVMKNTDKFGKTNHLVLNKTTTLFISILKTNELTYKNKKEFLIKLRAISMDTFISKFLIFIFNDKEGKKFKYFLNLSWKNELIDIFLNEILIKFNEEANNHVVATGKYINFHKMKISWNIFYNSMFVSKIHSFNPFTQIYCEESFDKNRILFPDKVKNLNKYKLRVGVVDYPPYSDVSVAKDGKMLFRGPGGELINSLIKYINFTIVPEIGSLSQYGVLLPNGSVTGLLAKIKDRKLDAIAFGAFVFYTAFINEVRFKNVMFLFLFMNVS
jgi:hypothetical protein